MVAFGAADGVNPLAEHWNREDPHRAVLGIVIRRYRELRQLEKYVSANALPSGHARALAAGIETRTREQICRILPHARPTFERAFGPAPAV